MTRTVGHRIHGRIEVFGFADSIPEALALEAALKSVPVAEAYAPVAHHATPTEDALPPHALADSDDNAGELKHGEAV